MSLVLLIYQPGDQLLPDTGCVALTAFAADHFRAEDLRPAVGRPLAAFTTLGHNLLGRPLVVPTKRHLLNIVVLRDTLDDSDRHPLSFPTPTCRAVCISSYNINYTTPPCNKLWLVQKRNNK